MNTTYIRQFEKYYNGEMTPEEKASFEKFLSEDQALSTAFKEYLSIYEALSDRDTLDLRTKLKEIREENARKKFNNDFFMHGYNWLWMAALLTIIISFTVIVSLLITKAEMDTQVVTGLENIETEKYSALNRELIKFEQRNMNFVLTSPDDELFISRKDPLVFEWTVNSTNPLILELIDWEGKIIFSSKEPVTSPYTVKKKLPGGITVYRFRTDKESYCIGFLFLK